MLQVKKDVCLNSYITFINKLLSQSFLKCYWIFSSHISWSRPAFTARIFCNEMFHINPVHHTLYPQTCTWIIILKSSSSTHQVQNSLSFWNGRQKAGWHTVPSRQIESETWYLKYFSVLHVPVQGFSASSHRSGASCSKKRKLQLLGE